MIAGFLIGLCAAGIFVIDHCLYHRKYMKKLDEEKREYQRKIEYNKAHLPSKELPPLSPGWTAVDRFIMETRFSFWVEGDGFAYNVGEYNSKRRYIAKSELHGDTLRFIELLKRDVNWFHAHALGSVGEAGTALDNFLREKYPEISEKSRARIVQTFCINER